MLVTNIRQVGKEIEAQCNTMKNLDSEILQLVATWIELEVYRSGRSWWSHSCMEQKETK